MSRTSTLVSIHEQIAMQLRFDIRKGLLTPGAPLREEHLASRFGVSRSPIRQVLQQLTLEGLLHARPNCGTVVAEPPTPEVAAALYECRAKLECIALRQCFDDLGEREFSRWRDILAAMRDCAVRGDFDAMYHQDWRFHRVLIDKASPSGSLGVYFAIAGATSDFLSVNANRPFHADAGELYGMHAALLEMFRKGDVDIACEALAQHILQQEFVSASCRLWTEAGKPWDYEGVYDELIPALRTALRRRGRTRVGKSRRPTIRRKAHN
jgi:DNA-binding GntR family transcriptional regulator